MLDIDQGTYAALLAMPTLATGRAGELKLEIRDTWTGTKYQVWVSPPDREPHPSGDVPPVSVEWFEPFSFGWAGWPGTPDALVRALREARRTGLLS